MNLTVYLSIFIPLFGGVGLFGFKYFKTFNFYKVYFYFITYSIILFCLGWNLSLFFSDVEKYLIDWWFIVIMFVFLIYTKVIHKLSETEFYKYYEPEW